MDLFDLTARELKRAAVIKERIAALNRELSKLLGTSADGTATQDGRRLSAAARRRIATAQKARWAKLRREKGAKASARASSEKTKPTTSANASRSAKLKAYWAAKKARRKKPLS